MSWFVTPDAAYGGNKFQLRKLLGYMFSIKKFTYKQTFQENKFDMSKCASDCSTIQGVMFRSWSILRQSKTFPIKIQ